MMKKIIDQILKESRIKKADKVFEMHMKDIDDLPVNQLEIENAIQQMVDDTELKIEDASFDYADGTGDRTHHQTDVYTEGGEDITLNLTLDEAEDNTIDELIKGTPFTFDEMFDINLSKSYGEFGNATLKLDYKIKKIDKNKAEIEVNISDDIKI